MAEITAIAPNPEGEMVVVNVAEQAIQKLEKELAANKEPYAQAIINYLIGRVKESNSLAMDVMQEHKTWPGCWDYIYAKASKAPRKGNCAAIEDKVVFEWAEDYYHAEFSKKNDWAKTKKEKETDDALVGASVAGAMKSAGFDKKSKSAKKTTKTAKKAEQTTEGSEPPKTEKPKKAAKAEKKEKAPKAPDRDAPDKKESKEKKKPKKDKQIEGQMSLEDLFGAF